MCYVGNCCHYDVICYLQRVGRLFLSVQWFQSVQKLSIHSEYPVIVPCYHQVAVITRQAVELLRTEK